MENGESVFDKNNRLRAKIGLPPLPQPGTIVQLDAGFIVNSSSEQAFVNTTEIEDGEYTLSSIKQKEQWNQQISNMLKCKKVDMIDVDAHRQMIIRWQEDR